MKFAYARVLSIFLLTVYIHTCCYAQNNALDKKLENVRALAAANKLDDAEKQLKKILKEDPSSGEAWDMLVSVQYQQYEQIKPFSGLLSGKITVVTKDSAGNEVHSQDSLANSLKEMLSKFDPAKKAYSKYVYTLRKATCMSRSAREACVWLRKMNADIEIDSNVNKKAVQCFNDAEIAFSEKNYNKAANLYKRACELQPGFYKAQMYLGDCYYAQQMYDLAINSFKESKNKYPFLLEPRKYLTDTYFKLSAYDKALDEAIASTTVYPDFSMFDKIEDGAYVQHKRLNIEWTPRLVLPNMIDKDTSDINQYMPDEDEEDDTARTRCWNYYKDALPAIAQYCNKKGLIVKSNTLTTERYLEVYSWKEMLKKSNDPSLEQARQMQQRGYLDCYVLVTCFHNDIYDQYKDFVRNNEQRIIEYYNTFISAQ